MAKKIIATKPTKPSSSPSKDPNRKIFLSLFDRNAVWDDKDEVLDAIYWIRQVLAVIMGLVWGFLGLRGFVGIISFVILNSITAYAIANKTGYEFEPDENFLSVKEGFVATFASFLVTWIVSYTAVHFD